MKKVSFWTQKRVENLVKYYSQYRTKEQTYTRVAKRLRAPSTNAVYKKLGRMGLLSAPWSQRESQKHEVKH